MADAAVQITEGTGGIFVDTRTEAGSSQHRQVVVLGDPATNAGVAPVSATDRAVGQGHQCVANDDRSRLPALPAGSNTIGNVDLSPEHQCSGTSAAPITRAWEQAPPTPCSARPERPGIISAAC